MIRRLSFRVRCALMLVVMLATIGAGVVWAQQQTNGRYIQTQTVTNATTFRTCTDAGSTPINCYADVATNAAFMTVESNSIRWTVNGTAPTTTTGHLAQSGATITLQGHTNVTQFQMIATAGNATVTSSVFRP